VKVLSKSRQYVIRSSPSSFTASPEVPCANPYTGMSWEDMNGKLHSTYPIIPNMPGVISIQSFDLKAAVQDLLHLSELKKNEVDEDPDLYLVNLWMIKIKNAIRAAKGNIKSKKDDSDSEDV
jgi:hypothetical protein